MEKLIWCSFNRIYPISTVYGAMWVFYGEIFNLLGEQFPFYDGAFIYYLLVQNLTFNEINKMTGHFQESQRRFRGCQRGSMCHKSVSEAPQGTPGDSREVSGAFHEILRG